LTPPATPLNSKPSPTSANSSPSSIAIAILLFHLLPAESWW
jgi:hypothetical protein